MKKGLFLLVILCLSVMSLFSDVTRQSTIVPEEIETIQEAIDIAVSGDLIIVLPGIYYENINFLGKEIVVGSLYYTTQDTIYISQTVIDGGQNGRVVTFDNEENGNSVLSGLTITNGEVSGIGGGIFCDDNASPTLEHLIVTNNQASTGAGLYFGQNSSTNLSSTLVMENNSTYSGGGAYMYYCDLIMEDVVFENNESGYEGGGLSFISSEVTMNNVSVINNTATGNYTEGGGILNYWESVINMDSCLVEGNYARLGGGIHCYEMSTLNMENSVIRNNESSYSGGGAYFSWETGITIENSIIDNNYAGDEGGGLWLGGNSVNLQNVQITNNTAETFGGGIYLYGWVDIKLVNTTIAGNTAMENGGGIYSYYYQNDIKLLNSVLWDNAPQTVYMNWTGNSYNSDLTLAYIDLEGGYEAIESNNFDHVIINWLEGNIDEDPGFVDAENGNYQLVSSSPCIDSGTAYFEFAGEVLIDLEVEEYEGDAPDMGAYEFNGVKYGDINNDNETDSYDASLLLMYVIGLDPLEYDPLPWDNWRLERADVDLNNQIDALDAALILQNSVDLIELPVTGGIRGSNDITISHDDDYIYLNSGTELISLEYEVEQYSNLKLGFGEVTADDCLYRQNGGKMAIISAGGISGNIVQIPYTKDYDRNGSYITLAVICNGYHDQMEYSFTGEAPLVNEIKAVYPNPFNPETTIEYQLAQSGRSNIEVFNIKGQKITTLLDEDQGAGNHSFRWNAEGQTSGVYFIRIQNGTFEVMKKVILLK